LDFVPGRAGQHADESWMDQRLKASRNLAGFDLPESKGLDFDEQAKYGSSLFQLAFFAENQPKGHAPVTGSQPDVRKRTVKSASSKIVKKVWIRASKEVVYNALIEPKELVQWFCDRVSLNPCEGGELVAYWRGQKLGQKGRAVITRLVPAAAIEFLWTDDGSGVQENKASHTLSYEIQSKSEMTVLVMTDKDESVSDEETTEFLDKGWNSVLLDLKEYCERRERALKLKSHPDSLRDAYSE
jgi:uncharacterized protein YndB with AHSA1/START domain